MGKAENSSGFWIQSATIRISTDSAIEKASPTSISTAGTGRNSTARIATMPAAKPKSRRDRFSRTSASLTAMTWTIPLRWQRL